MAKIKTKTVRGDRGWTRHVKIDGQTWGCIQFVWHDATDGSAFARAYRNGSAVLRVLVFNKPLEDVYTPHHQVTVDEIRTTKAGRLYRNGDKWAREQIAQCQLVERIVQIVNGGE